MPVITKGMSLAREAIEPLGYIYYKSWPALATKDSGITIAITKAIYYNYDYN